MYKKISLALATTVLLTGQAFAEPILDWNFTLDSGWLTGQWTDDSATDTAGSGILEQTLYDGTGDVVGSDTLAWFDTNGRSSQISVQNGNIDDGIFSLVETAPGSDIYAGTAVGSTLYHVNNSLNGGTTSLESAVLQDIFKMVPAPGDAAASAPLFEVDFDIDFVETPNGGTCDWSNGATGCDDVFIINIEDLTQSFTLGGYVYTLNIFAPNVGELDPGACLAAGIEDTCYGVQTPENGETTVDFTLALTATAVPEPSIMALMGLGLLGFGFRRRKAAKK